MDKYDKAIEHLTANPHEIPDAWNFPNCRDGGCLFKFAQRINSDYALTGVGCLTQIRGDGGRRGVEGRPDLTDQIVADERIPVSAEYITVDSLQVFAEWQRRLDAELDRS